MKKFPALNIALIGYGKMGKAIENILLRQGHTIALKISSSNVDELTIRNLQGCDAAIEFTGPHTAVKNISTCIHAGIPVVCGSTGWLQQWDEVKKYCENRRGGLLYASNFSVGVNIFFEVNKRLATLMANRNEYDVTIEEIHHTQKKDAPSGTAISIAEGIINELPRKKSWKNDQSQNNEELTIISKRIDPAPGTHIVKYISEVDELEIIHTAHNRNGFAEGAVMAAEFIAGKKGIFTMKEVLGI
ncbi:MAG: 4-hydroxy-tetrahydrodipicolinate reductase [Ferruginibacter sp.]